MENNTTKLSADLQKFINKFEPTKFKLLAKGIEIRGMNNIHQNIRYAKELIEKLNLKLTVSHNADMVSYGGFEVNNL
ncbi:MAG TPA: hypothetical protein VKB19_18675 [Pedobacter sp.]|nr:hypothetical protein [Pedobacter sp.]